MGFLSKIFGKKEVSIPPVDLGVLKTDVHSHLIPGIDDGSKTLDETITLLRSFVELGYEKVITTPHIMSDFYRNTPEIIMSGLETVRNEIERLGIPIAIEAAAEYNLDAGFQPLLEEGKLLTFGGDYVLFELPFLSEPPMLYDTIWAMQNKGYIPVLAHVERYSFWHGDFSKIAGLKDRGVMLQLNINSLTGHYGPMVREIGEKMIDGNLVDLLGTDCHNMNHINLLQHARTRPYLEKVLNNKKLLNYKL